MKRGDHNNDVDLFHRRPYNFLKIFHETGFGHVIGAKIGLSIFYAYLPMFSSKNVKITAGGHKMGLALMCHLLLIDTVLLDTLSPKTSGTLRETRKERE